MPVLWRQPATTRRGLEKVPRTRHRKRSNKKRQGTFTMNLTRRTALSAASAVALLPAVRARAQTKPIIKIGVINDQSGPYRDLNGPTSVICTKQAVQEFAASGFDVEVLSADHQN